MNQVVEQIKTERDSQELLDWKEHPITRNFYAAVNEAVEDCEFYLSNLRTDFDEREISRRIGIQDGLRALIDYEPVFDEAGVIIDDV